jgi:arsenate reductase-like glutaredoxin family protein
MEEIKVKRVRSKSHNRDKGNSMERLLAKEFRELGYPDCATSRATSKMLDNAKCDLNFVDFIVQSKSVIKNLTYSDYVALLKEVEEGINGLPEKMKKEYIEYPKMVFHKGKLPKTLVIITKEDFYKIVKQLPK